MEFDPFSAEYFDGAYDTFRWMRDEAPVYHNPRLSFYALSRWEDVQSALRDCVTFSSGEGVTLPQLNNPEFKGVAHTPGAMLFYDPPDHTRLRNLTKTAFTARAVNQLEVLIRTLTRQYLERFGDGSEFDFVDDFSTRFTADAVSALLDVPEGDRDLVWRLCDDFIFAGEGHEAKSAAAQVQVYEYFSALVAERRAHPDRDPDDVVSSLIGAAYVDENGVRHSLTGAEICGYCFLLYLAGTETTARLLGSAVVEFDRHPDQWRRLRDDPTLIPSAIEEIGRYLPPAQDLGRRVTRGVDIHGQVIPQGAPLLLVIAAANRDERVFPAPDTFDITRKNARPPCTFGAGPHTCLGMNIARLEARVALEEILKSWHGFEIDHTRLVRTQNVNLVGYSNVPLKPIRVPALESNR
jgi:cytochrome P450